MLVQILYFALVISVGNSLETYDIDVECCTSETDEVESALKGCNLCENKEEGCTNESFMKYMRIESMEEKAIFDKDKWTESHFVHDDHHFKESEMWIINPIVKQYVPIESFDPRENESLLKKCPSITHISDQGNCDSCWAIAATDVMTDRLCWNSENGTNFRYSVEDLLGCCRHVDKVSVYKKEDIYATHARILDCIPDVEKDEGGELRCKKGGSADLAWKYWIRFGIVSGGFGNNHEGCKNYKTTRCNHMNRTAYEKYSNTPVQQSYKYLNLKFCDEIEPQRPACHSGTLRCDEEYKGDTNYTRSLKRGKSVTIYKLENNNSIKMEIKNNGSVHAIMKAYTSLGWYYPTEDTYYEPKVNDERAGSHSIRIIGWKKVKDTDCWIVANSWGKHWGDLNGFFYLPFNFEGDEKVYAGYHHPE